MTTAGYEYWRQDYWLDGYWIPNYWKSMALPCFVVYDETTLPAVFVRDVDYTTSIVTGNCHQEVITGMLPAGEYTLGISYIDQYGNESRLNTINVPFDGSGNVRVQFVSPFRVTATAIAAGYVTVTWFVQNVNQFQVQPAEYEIAEVGDLSTILDTVTATSSNNYTIDVGAFANGDTIGLRVRSSDGAGTYGPWVAANDVVADSVAPAAPTIVP
jgi:hypothetical protein